MANEACCTCARLLTSILPQYDEKKGKPLMYGRQLECCDRFICGVCIARNSRFASYCPFCQISTAPTSLPQGVLDPPQYSSSTSPGDPPGGVNLWNTDELPIYSTQGFQMPRAIDKAGYLEEAPEDILHFLDPVQDTISSLSLRYGVPQGALRRTNNLFADHLLAARRTILIPGEFYTGGVSLSPQPINGEDQEIKKAKVRRWMVACKVAEYDIALLYLEQVGYELDGAVEAYLADENWEKDHPVESPSSGKAERKSNNWKYGINTSIPRKH